jgi:hypothetical protein
MQWNETVADWTREIDVSHPVEGSGLVRVEMTRPELQTAGEWGVLFRFTGEIVLEPQSVFGVDAFQALELAFPLVGFWMDMISKNQGWTFAWQGRERGGFPTMVVPIKRDLGASD